MNEDEFEDDDDLDESRGTHTFEDAGEVTQYLIDEYDLDPDNAHKLVEKHREIIERGIRIGSFLYYVGDEVMKAEDNADR